MQCSSYKTSCRNRQLFLHLYCLSIYCPSFYYRAFPYGARGGPRCVCACVRACVRKFETMSYKFQGYNQPSAIVFVCLVCPTCDVAQAKPR